MNISKKNLDSFKQNNNNNTANNTANNNKKILIIITIPHAKCPNVQNRLHLCDFSAKANGEKLYSLLQNAKNPSILSEIIIGDIPRNVCDLNRFECRNNTVFRKRIRTIINENKKNKNIFLIDMHSYPNQDSFGKNADVVLLYKNKDGFSNHAVNLWNFLGRNTKESGIKIILIKGKDNDIIYEAQNILSTKSILIEFYEKLSENNINIILKQIVEWIQKKLPNLLIKL